MEREKLKGSLFISTKDIQIINDWSLRKSQKELQTIADILQTDRSKISVQAYCDYWALDYEEVVKHINPFR